ncbi:MAG: PfkB family carbohydrate kinase [Gemmataceae bacterium]
MSEVVTFGEAMVRLTPPSFQRVEQARSLDVHVAGAELNTAVTLARLGCETAWVSRLTNNPIGRVVANHAREGGVNTDHIAWTDEDRIGLLFLENGASPRASSVVYDRKNSAMARIQPGMIHWPSVFSRAKWFHITGITPALSESSRATTREALEAAKRSGVRVSFDPNYRSKLWSLEECHECVATLLPLCDVLITSMPGAALVLQVEGNDEEDVARRLIESYGLELVAFTRRESSSVRNNTFTGTVYTTESRYETKTYEVEIVDRLGAGDAFAGGLLFGLWQENIQTGLDYGVAAAALKHTIPGDFAWVTVEELQHVVEGGSLRIQR